jgi:hypothetical protein
MARVSQNLVGINLDHPDDDIVLQPPGGPAVDCGAAEPCPVWAIDQARVFGRRLDWAGFSRWLASQTSHAENRQRLQREFQRAAADERMEAWRRVWRLGIAPRLSTAGLEGLRDALINDDPRLIAGAATIPPALACCVNDPLQSCCPVCFGLLDGEPPGALLVGEMESRFVKACLKADQLCGMPGAVSMLLNAIDEWTRPQLIANLLPEVLIALVGREPASEAESPLARQLKDSIEAVKRNGSLQ